MNNYPRDRMDSGPVEHRPWTREEDNALRLYASSGASAAQIGIQLHRSRSAVCGRAWRLNLSLSGDPQKRRPKSPTSRDARKAERTRERKEAALDMWFAGMYPEEICRELCMKPGGLKWIIIRARKRGDTRAVYKSERGHVAAKRIVSAPDHHCGRDTTFLAALMNGVCAWHRAGEEGHLGLVCGCERYMGQSYCKTHVVIACAPARRPDLLRAMERAERRVAA